MIRWLAVLLCPVAALIFFAAPARADLGGEVPAPGTCDYPAVGHSGMYFNVYVYVCDFPTEVNGAHHHCEYGGAVIQGSAGISIAMFNGSLSGNLGVISGWCDWLCPNGARADQPNPPGGWKNFTIPRPCKPMGAPPLSPWATAEDPNPPAPQPPPPLDQMQPIVGQFEPGGSPFGGSMKGDAEPRYVDGDPEACGDAR